MTDLDEPRLWLRVATRAAYHSSPELWRFGTSERARVGQIFVEIQKIVPSRWAVDIEYNRQGTDGDSKAFDCEGSRALGTPDLVIHHRGETGPEHNLLVAEFKNDRRSMSAESRDWKKVVSWMTAFKYQHGAVVSLGKNATDFDPQVIWLNETASDRSPAEL
jgi:hypothetical protein